jgi:1-deoxy-D-xylulose-5-phosphate reductoisomerase
MKPKTIGILGSTGSIGVNALKIVASYPDYFTITSLSAGRQIERLAEQIRAFSPQLACVERAEDIDRLRDLLGQESRTELVHGTSGLAALAAHPSTDLVISAIVGFAGVRPTLAALQAGKCVALANKESIVAAGPLIREALKQSPNARLIPVDSEHSAVFQALHGDLAQAKTLKRIILTASGGPFRDRAADSFASITKEEALKHPNWSMGAKITIDSATMMNKGLEVIEASYLFSVPSDQIAVLLHPESIIHSMIEYRDGSMLAQLGQTDMRGPLSYAMAYPARLDGALPSIDLSQVGKLTFAEPDLKKFPCLALGLTAAQAGHSIPAVLNAANEVCVENFLENRIAFNDIARIIAQTMEAHTLTAVAELEQLCAIDAWARRTARGMIEETTCRVC